MFDSYIIKPGREHAAKETVPFLTALTFADLNVSGSIMFPKTIPHIPAKKDSQVAGRVIHQPVTWRDGLGVAMVVGP